MIRHDEWRWQKPSDKAPTKRREAKRRLAISGMLEVLILISIATVGTSILAGWFAAEQQQQLTDIGCITWVDTKEVSTNRHWAQASIYNTGDHTIDAYHVQGAGSILASGTSPIQLHEKVTVEFMAGDADIPVIEILVSATTAAGGTALCEVLYR